MAQLQPSVVFVTPTNGEDWENLPINPENVLRAYETEVTIGTTDLNLYPAIQFDLVTKAVQYWIYALGDTASRDADLVLANAAIGGAELIIAYGGIWGENQSTNLTLTVLNDWYPFNDFEADFASKNCTPQFALGNVKIDKSGDYGITLAGSIELPTAETYQISVFQGAVRLVGLTNKVDRLAAESTRQRISISGGAVTLAENDLITAQIRCNTAAGIVVRMRDLQLSVKKLD